MTHIELFSESNFLDKDARKRSPLQVDPEGTKFRPTGTDPTPYAKPSLEWFWHQLSQPLKGQG